MSVQTFIKTLRLERGMQLLQDHHLSVSEVADRAGFLDLSYSRRYFKEHFGISPTQVTRDKQHDTQTNETCLSSLKRICREPNANLFSFNTRGLSAAQRDFLLPVPAIRSASQYPEHARNLTSRWWCRDNGFPFAA